MRQEIMKELGAFIRVSNMTSDNGNKIPNQFILEFENGRVFQSYESIIVVSFWYSESGKHNNKTYFGEDWNASRTTSKYRNRFLHRDTEWCKKQVTDNKILVLDLDRR